MTGGTRQVPLAEVVTAVGGVVRHAPGGTGREATAERVGTTHGPDMNVNPPLSSVAFDSRRVEPGALFACIPGFEADGHDYALGAVAAGAVALLVDHVVPDVPPEVPQVVVPDVRGALGAATCSILGDPGDRLRLVGVTGTNGKTTVVSLVAHLAATAGIRAEAMGTLTGARTTPEAPDLYAALHAAADEGVELVATEVSSHALALGRVDGLTFDVAAFTTLGRDHLDFHGTVAEYFAAKARLFEPHRTRHAVVVVDDPYGRRIVDSLGDPPAVPVTSVTLDDADDLQLQLDGSTFTWRGQRVRLPMAGRLNVCNALVAAEVVVALGVTPAQVADGLATVPQVPGRFEAVSTGTGFGVIVDYAHTPDALERVLASGRELVAREARLIVVFGCGGNRDQGKRPDMGRAATEGADVVVLTSDNPRSEGPEAIIEEIRAGCGGSAEVVVEPDRRAAIGLALRAARAGDLVVVAGKGHERVQVFADRVVPFDDREVVDDELKHLSPADPRLDSAARPTRESPL